MPEESPILRGVTFNQFSADDYSHLFRKQNNRSLNQIDELLYHHEKLRQSLGEERAAQIAASPDLFYNHEKFRLMQASARARAFLTTLVVAPAIIVAFQKSGRFVPRYQKVGLGLGIFVASFTVWHRIVGYGSQVKNEQEYAKSQKMIRNLMIRA
ncbi:UNKNOWN [Stylonychia lemnae]|uniref:Uncharacterized protein n=1 Tax=Stylonychia lemnae TaxID=5949 RepID=A0A077ZXV8_STYLE|nr:UNKNOWN [Stylonychia lemnae]|eukprot:CDW74072.1 UNKNOWN [Stylonychia lemnae]